MGKNVSDVVSVMRPDWYAPAMPRQKTPVRENFKVTHRFHGLKFVICFCPRWKSLKMCGNKKTSTTVKRERVNNQGHQRLKWHNCCYDLSTRWASCQF